MKGFMKNCAIIAAVLIVLGMGMTLAVAAFKGPSAVSGLVRSVPWKELRDNIETGLDTLDSGVRFELEDSIVFDSDNPVTRGNTDQTFSAEQVKKLDVEAGACEFYIEESGDGDFHVEVEDAGKYQGYISGDKLHVRGMSKTTVGTGAECCTIRLYVPADFVFEKVELSLGAGSIEGNSKLQADSMDIELGAGDMMLESLVTDKLDADVGMGSLEMAGDIRQKADVKCAMGSILMELAGEETDFNYEVEVAAGNVDIGPSSFSAMAGVRDIENGAEKEISVECAMGSIEITFE